MGRKLFCEINSFTYGISVRKKRFVRSLSDAFSNKVYAKMKEDKLQNLVYEHSSLIRRKLGNVDMHLQENKAVNLSLAAPKINGIIVKPKETFSFWRLVGECTAKAGYKEGLIIFSDKPSKGIGGGLCQFTNLIHWLILHSPLDIDEHHHHDGIDLFPDFGRQVPFGCGTSIVYNYLDYQFTNNTDCTFQLIVYVTDTHLCGELRVSKVLQESYHIKEEDAYFIKKYDEYYRRNKIIRQVVDKRTGNELRREVIKESNARVMYEEEFIDKSLLRIE